MCAIRASEDRFLAGDRHFRGRTGKSDVLGRAQCALWVSARRELLCVVLEVELVGAGEHVTLERRLRLGA